MRSTGYFESASQGGGSICIECSSSIHIAGVIYSKVSSTYVKSSTTCYIESIVSIDVTVEVDLTGTGSDGTAISYSEVVCSTSSIICYLEVSESGCTDEAYGDENGP